jgi:hypothetical protein
MPGLAAKGLAIGLQFGWLAGAVGLRLNTFSSPIVLSMSAVLTDVIVIIVVFASALRLRPAIWLWLGLFAYVFAANAIFAVERTAMFGVWIMPIGRYHTDEVFLTFAAIAMAYGAAYLPQTSMQIASVTIAKARSGWVTAGLGAVAGLCQLLGGLDYPNPPAVDFQGARAFILSIRHAAAHLAPGQSVGDRQLPERIVSHWLQPWNELSNFATVLPERLPTSSWDRADYDLDDDGRFHAFARLSRQPFKDLGNHDLVLAMVPPIESIGYFETSATNRVVIAFNPSLAPPDKVRIAVVAHGHIVAWATREERPDGAAGFNWSDVNLSGFYALLPHGERRDDVHALAVIDNRIGIILPRISDGSG